MGLCRGEIQLHGGKIMNPFENYECDGQISIDEYMNSNYPKQCCDVAPWLHKTKCCRWDESKPQTYMMYYICPKCGKTVVDEIGWVKYRHGTNEKASRQALEDWNDPKSKFEVKEFNNPIYGNYININCDEREKFERLYGIRYEEYKKPLVEISNELFRKKQEEKNNVRAAN